MKLNKTETRILGEVVETPGDSYGLGQVRVLNALKSLKAKGLIRWGRPSRLLIDGKPTQWGTGWYPTEEGKALAETLASA